MCVCLNSCLFLILSGKFMAIKNLTHLTSLTNHETLIFFMQKIKKDLPAGQISILLKS